MYAKAVLPYCMILGSMLLLIVLISSRQPWHLVALNIRSFSFTALGISVCQEPHTWTAAFAILHLFMVGEPTMLVVRYNANGQGKHLL